jgi:hypothetical protein
VVFGKLFGRGKPKRDAFGLETTTATVAVPGSSEATVVTTTSETRSLGFGDLFGVPSARAVDLSGMLAAIQRVQAETSGDSEAMAKLLRERFGGEASVVVDEQASAGWSVLPTQQPDPIALLATLSELHEKGVVTDAQFDEQKRRLLGET